MNDKQKIFVMVGAGSFVVLLLTIFGLDLFSLENPFSSTAGLSTQAKYQDGIRHTNWLGIIAVFNIVVSITGFFLFKDK